MAAKTGKEGEGMSEQPDKNSPYHLPTAAEHLEAALKALDGATDENWCEHIEDARRSLAALEEWIGGNLLASEKDNKPIQSEAF